MDCNYTTSPISVDHVVVDAALTSRNFLVFGQRMEGSTQTGVIVHVNFTDLLVRECRWPTPPPDDPESDYEYWSPSNLDGSCVLGQHTVYVRRRGSVVCYNGDDFVSPPPISRACPCTREDFECETCFSENPVTKACVFDEQECGTNDPAIDASYVCQNPNVRSYRLPAPYRLVAGTKCTLNNSAFATGYLGAEVPCSRPTASSPFIPIVLALFTIAVLLLLVGGCLVLLKRNEAFYEFWARTIPSLIAPRFGRTAASAAVYSQLGTPETLEDEEAKELDDDTLNRLDKSKEAAAKEPATDLDKP